MGRPEPTSCQALQADRRRFPPPAARKPAAACRWPAGSPRLCTLCHDRRAACRGLWSTPVKRPTYRAAGGVHIPQPSPGRLRSAGQAPAKREQRCGARGDTLQGVRPATATKRVPGRVEWSADCHECRWGAGMPLAELARRVPPRRCHGADRCGGRMQVQYAAPACQPSCLQHAAPIGPVPSALFTSAAAAPRQPGPSEARVRAAARPPVLD